MNITQHLKDLANAVVLKTTNQTIAGIKTFSSSPILPTPTSGDNSTKGATTSFVQSEKVGSVIQVANYTTGTVSTGTTQIPTDNTVPQITEGFQIMSLAFTAKKANSKLKIDVVSNIGVPGALAIIHCIFKDSNVNSIATVWNTITAGSIGDTSFTAYIDAVDTSSHTFSVRVGGGGAGTVTFNGISGTQYFGGSLASSITITEIAQ